MNQYDHLRPIDNRLPIGSAKVAVHENGRFRGREDMFEIGGQEKGRFYGRYAPDRGCQR